MALLRKSDPDLYELLSSMPGSQEDEDMLKMFAGGGTDGTLGKAGGGDADEDDADLAEMLKVWKCGNDSVVFM